MSVDLDELFDAMGRQADAVPLGGAERARKRGRHRSRVRAVVSVAAAVVLVAVGAGLTLREPGEQALPADKHLQGTPVPEVGAPVDLGGPVAFARVATDGDRAYTAWIRADDNSLRLTATYLEDAEPYWVEPQLIVDPQRSLRQVVVVQGAVLVVTEAFNGSKPDLGLFAFDPTTGLPLWSKQAAADDSVVFSANALVHVTAATGGVDGFDWVSGDSIWSRATGDPIVRAIGMATLADEAKYNRSGPSPTFSDGRVVLLTRDAAEVRDAATGVLRRLVPVAAESGETAVAYDGWLVTHDEADDHPGPQTIRVTELVGSARTAVVPEKLPGRFLAMSPCGKDRVCVLTQTLPASPASPPITRLTAIDVRKRQTLWQRDSTYGADEISSAGGATLITSETGGAPEIFDADGKLRYQATLSGDWLDGRSLLVTAPDGTGRLAKLSTGNYRLTPYARHIGHFGGYCASTSTRLVCADETTGLKIWKIG